MKRFMIHYRFRLDDEAVEAWHRAVAEFISRVDSDPRLGGRVGYRCMKAKERGEYYHLAEAVDDDAIQALVQSDFFKRYTEETKRVAGGDVEVVPLETIAETRGSA